MNFRCFNCNATENLYRAPESAEMRDYWLDLFPDDGGPEIFTQSFRICAEHFDNKFILANGQLSSKAVPTKFLVHNVWCEIDEYSDDTDDSSTCNTTINPTPSPMRIPPPSPMRIPPRPPELLLNEQWTIKQAPQNQTILRTGLSPTQQVVHSSILPESNRPTFIQTSTGIIRIAPSVSTISNITQRVINRPFPGANSQLISNQQIVIAVSPPRPPSTMSPQVSQLSLGSGQIQIPAGHTIQFASTIPTSGTVGIVNPFQTAGHVLTSTNTLNQPIIISSPLNSPQIPISISTTFANSTSPVQPKIPASISTAFANSSSHVQPKIPTSISTAFANTTSPKILASISTASANTTSPVPPKIPASISTASANSTSPLQHKIEPKPSHKTTEMQNFLPQSTKDRIVAATILQQAFIDSSEKLLQAKQKAALESKIKSEQEEPKTSTDKAKLSPKSFNQNKPADEPKPTPKSFDPSTTDLEEIKPPPSASPKTIDVAEQAASPKGTSQQAKPDVVKSTSGLSKQQTSEETDAKPMLAADVLSQPIPKKRAYVRKIYTIQKPKQLRRSRREENAASESHPTGTAADSKLKAALLKSEKVVSPPPLKRRKQCKIAVVLLKRQKLEPAILSEKRRSNVKQRRKSVSFASTVSTTRKMVKYNNKIIKAEVAITASPTAVARRKLFQLFEDDEPVVEDSNDNGDILSKDNSPEAQPLPIQSTPSPKSARISSSVASQWPLRIELTPKLSSNSLPSLSLKSAMKSPLRSSPKSSRESAPELLVKSTPELLVKSTPELSAKSTSEMSPKSTPDLSSKSTTELSAKSTPQLSAKSTSGMSPKSTPDLFTKSTPELSAQPTSELSAKSTPELSLKSTPKLLRKLTPKLLTKSAPTLLPKLAPKPSVNSTPKLLEIKLPTKSPKASPIKSPDSTNNTISTVTPLTPNTSSSFTSSFVLSPLGTPSINPILRNSPNTSSASIGDLTPNNQLCQASQLQSKISPRKGLHTIDMLPVSEQLKFYKAEFKRVKSKKTTLMAQVDKYTDRFNKLRNYLERLTEAGLIMKRAEIKCTITVDYHTDVEVSDDKETIEIIEETPTVVSAPERESTEPLDSKQDSENVEMRCVLTSTLFRQQNSLDLLRHLTNLAKQQHAKPNSSIVNDVRNKALNPAIDRLRSEGPALSVFPEVQEISSEDEEEDATVIRLNRSEMVNYYWNNLKFTSCIRKLKLFQRDFSKNEGSKLDPKIESEIETLKLQKTELRSKLNAANVRLNSLERNVDRFEAFIAEISNSSVVPEGDKMYEMMQKLMKI